MAESSGETEHTTDTTQSTRVLEEPEQAQTTIEPEPPRNEPENPENEPGEAQNRSGEPEDGQPGQPEASVELSSENKDADPVAVEDDHQDFMHDGIVDPTLAPEIASALAPLNERTITGRLQRQWIVDPEKEVLVFYDDDDERSSLKNAEFKELVEGCASLLRCNGVRKGDIVCNTLDVSPEREVMNYAIIISGAVLMDGLCIVDEGHRFWAPLIKANVKHLIVDPNDDSSMAWKMVAEDVGTGFADIERATIKEIPGLEKVFKFRMQHLMKSDEARKEKSGFQMINEHGSTFVEIANSYDPAVIYIRRTSSERIYKLVMRSHIAVIQLAQRAQEMLKLTKNDVIYNYYPISWLSGLSLAYIATGLRMIKTTLHNCPAQRVVRETWDVISQEQCTMASLEPPMIVMLASHCEDLPEDGWKLRAITTCGLVKPSVMDAIGTITESVINCYSVVEAGLVSRLVVTEATRTRFTDGCVGELTDKLRTRLDIKGTGAVMPNKIGEIVLRGKLVCKEYYNDEHLTRASFTADGFLKTGDLGFYDNARHSPYNDMLFVLGRKSQAIIRGDTAIFPRDVEEKVNQCPGIWKVSLVSIRDEKGIVQMCACVIPRSQDSLTIERVKEFCRYMLGGTSDDDDNPHMPTYVFFFSDFPMLGNEVDKHTLAHTTAAVVSGTDHIVGY